MSRSLLRLAPVLAVMAPTLALALPAEAGGPRGGYGGGHRPPAAPCCGHPGGNVNINVNAAAAAQASAYAGAGARSAINARGWSGYSAGRASVGGGTVYVGGGGYVAEGAIYGGPVYHDAVAPVAVAGPSAPFGYVVEGFGRQYGRGPAPWEVSRGPRRDDRATVYRQESYVRHEETRLHGGSRHAATYEDRYPGWSEAEAYAYWEGRARDAYDAGYGDGRADCDCGPSRRGAPHGHGERSHAPAPHHPPADPGYYGDLPPPGHTPPRAPHPVYGHPNQPGERG